MSTTLKMFRGDDYSFVAEVYDSTTESIIDITNFSILFTIKQEKSDTANLIQKSSASASEIEKTDAENGEYKVYIDAADTDNLTPDTDYWYDVQITNISNSKKYTILFGTFRINSDITR